MSKQHCSAKMWIGDPTPAPGANGTILPCALEPKHTGAHRTIGASYGGRTPWEVYWPRHAGSRYLIEELPSLRAP